jgi:hypothetical protein
MPIVIKHAQIRKNGSSIINRCKISYGATLGTYATLVLQESHIMSRSVESLIGPQNITLKVPRATPCNTILPPRFQRSIMSHPHLGGGGVRLHVPGSMCLAGPSSLSHLQFRNRMLHRLQLLLRNSDSCIYLPF